MLRRDAFALGVIALVLRVPTFAADRHFHPDDGTYGMSAVAMRHGASPFRTVFSSQGPLHLVTVYLGDLLTGRQMNSPRAAAVVFGVVATIATAAIGTRLGGRRGGLLAGALVATSGSMLWTSGPVTADAPTIAFVALALLAALAYAERPSAGGAVWVGAAIGAGMMSKVAVAFVGFLPAIVLLFRPRVGKHVAAASGTAAAIATALVVPFGASNVWDQAIRYQLDTERERSIAANALKVATTLWARDLIIIVALGGALAAWIARRPRRDFATGACAWLLAMVAFLIVQPALWRNHLSHMVVPAAVFIAATLGGRDARRVPPARPLNRRVVALAVIGCLVVAGVQLRFLRTILLPRSYDATSQAAVDSVRSLPLDARVVTDEIGLVWRAGHRTPDDLVDLSIKQIQQDRVTLARLRSITARPDVCAVLVWSARHLGSFAELPATLAASGYEVRERFAGHRVLYVRSNCPRSARPG
jgi:4-amino-4-deoxy-L-arabinose transferase-like glycosyltransferase